MKFIRHLRLSMICLKQSGKVLEKKGFLSVVLNTQQLQICWYFLRQRTLCTLGLTKTSIKISRNGSNVFIQLMKSKQSPINGIRSVNNLMRCFHKLKSLRVNFDILDYLLNFHEFINPLTLL